MKTLTKILIILYDTPKYLNTHILKFRLHHNDTWFIMITLVKFETVKIETENVRRSYTTFIANIFPTNFLRTNFLP